MASALLSRASTTGVAYRPLPIRTLVSRPSAARRPRTVPCAESGATSKELSSELIGSTLFQVIGGAAPAALAAPTNGLALMGLIYAFGATSGAHLNPAVSFMLLLRGKISGAKAIAYMAAQVAGAVLGAFICTILIPGVQAGAGLGAPGTFAPAAGLSNTAVFMWEALMTAGLGLVVYGAAVAKSAFLGSAPIGIAAAVMGAVMSAGPYTGCVINPARALGPAIVFGLSTSTVLLYVAAQMAGGALAAILAGAVHNE